MATVDLRELSDDQTSVNAYTFANSLVAFADTVRSVNEVLSPTQGIEVRLEALSPGSFRAVTFEVVDVIAHVPRGGAQGRLID